MATLVDSGERREFETGAVRDIQEGKGRCDLLPLSVVAPLMEKQEYANILYNIHGYMQTGDIGSLYGTIVMMCQSTGQSLPKLLLEVAKHYEDGALKYGEHNWQKGIPLHCYIDSAVRHFLKFADGQTDEPHDRAFVWNILSAIWTHINLPDMIDIQFPLSELLAAQQAEAESAQYDSDSDVVIESIDSETVVSE